MSFVAEDIGPSEDSPSAMIPPPAQSGQVIKRKRGRPPKPKGSELGGAALPFQDPVALEGRSAAAPGGSGHQVVVAEKKKRGRPKKDLALTAAAVPKIVRHPKSLSTLDNNPASSGHRQTSLDSPSRKFDGIQLMDPIVVRRQAAAVAALSRPSRPSSNTDVGISGAKGHYLGQGDFGDDEDEEEEAEEEDDDEDYVSFHRGGPQAQTSSKPVLDTAGAKKKKRGRPRKNFPGTVADAAAILKSMIPSLAVPPLGKKPRGRPPKVERD